ncbi:DUF6504 family protein [Kocuria rhizophila]|uniref:hypothetical protein n=1 Tax=Kocuria rhizophila TaxID=72000 RepID=UPI002ED6752D|nr:DUF6504 family protein [Kocuria rhizophila]
MTVLDTRQIESFEDPWDTVPVIGAALDPEAAGAAGEWGAEAAPEDVSVRCDAVGNPCELVYHGREQRVLEPVIHWFERRKWWDVEARVPRESRTSAVDRERWRVQAVQAGAAVARTFELTRNQATEQWQLLRVSV